MRSRATPNAPEQARQQAAESIDEQLVNDWWSQEGDES